MRSYILYALQLTAHNAIVFVLHGMCASTMHTPCMHTQYISSQL